MKYLGIDFGEKRIGLATSDPTGMLAFPRGILENSAAATSEVAALVRDEHIDEIVLGYSAGLDGSDNPVQTKIEVFKKSLSEACKKPIHFEKEFLTSFEARRYATNERVDDSAAALILQRYLDRHQNHSLDEEEK